MRSTFNLKKPNKKGESLIYLKAYFKDEGRKFVYSTGEVINSSEWDFDARLPNNLNGHTTSANKHRNIKLQLDRYSNYFTEITNLYKNTNQKITIEEIRNKFYTELKKVKKGKNQFFEAFEYAIATAL